MRIVQVCPYAWNAPGGVQTHVADLARELRLRGHDVLVVAPSDPQRPGVAQQEGLKLVGTCTRIPFNGSVAPVCLQPSGWLAARHAVSQFAPDLVHVHEPLNLSLPTTVTWSSPVPVVATFHMYCPRSLHGALYSVLAATLRPLTRRIALKLAVSEAAASTVEGRVGGRVHVVPNGVDIERFVSAAPRPLPPGRTLLFANRLDRRKGFDIAVRTFVALADRIEGLQLVVAGDGPDRSAVEQVPERLRSRLILLGDVAAEDMPCVYAAADVFISPARGHESFGIVLLEAMAAGLPIVATDIAGYREVVHDRREALLVAPGNVEEAARAVRRVFESRELADSLVAAGRSRVAQFAWNIVAAEVERYYAIATDRAAARSAVAIAGVQRRPALRSDD